MTRARRRRWLLVVASVLIALGAAEGLARLTDGPPAGKARKRALEARLANDHPPPVQAGAVDYEQFLVDREAVWFREPTQWAQRDYHLYGMAPVETETIRWSDRDGARECPDSAPPGPQTRTVWFFGGSTMENLEAPDVLTVANQAIRDLSRRGLRVAGRNFGTTAFQSSLEATKFLDLMRRRPADEHPDVAVFYDGYNDAVHGFVAGPGNLQPDQREAVRLLVEHDDVGLWRHALARWLGRHSVLARRFISPLIEPSPIGERPPVDLSERTLQHAVEVYVANVRMIRGAAEAMGVRPLFVLQPLVVTKQGLGPIDEEALASLPEDRRAFIRGFYDGARAALAGAPDWVDLSGALDHDGRSDFVDLGHTGVATGTTLGPALAEHIAPRLAP